MQPAPAATDSAHWNRSRPRPQRLLVRHGSPIRTRQSLLAKQRELIPVASLEVNQGTYEATSSRPVSPSWPGAGTALNRILVPTDGVVDLPVDDPIVRKAERLSSDALKYG